MDLFAKLIQELSTHLEIPLTADDQDSCAILVENTVLIKVEMSRRENQILLGCSLGEIPPGKYREELLKVALKENGANYPNLGILGFNPHKSELILFDQLNASTLNGEALAHYFQIFLDIALKWNKAIVSGVYPDSLRGLSAEKEINVIR